MHRRTNPATPQLLGNTGSIIDPPKSSHRDSVSPTLCLRDLLLKLSSLGSSTLLRLIKLSNQSNCRDAHVIPDCITRVRQGRIVRSNAASGCPRGRVRGCSSTGSLLLKPIPPLLLQHFPETSLLNRFDLLQRDLKHPAVIPDKGAAADERMVKPFFDRLRQLRVLDLLGESAIGDCYLRFRRHPRHSAS